MRRCVLSLGHAPFRRGVGRARVLARCDERAGRGAGRAKRELSGGQNPCRGTIRGADHGPQQALCLPSRSDRRSRARSATAAIRTRSGRSSRPKINTSSTKERTIAPTICWGRIRAASTGPKARILRCGHRVPAESAWSAISTTGTVGGTVCARWVHPGSGNCSSPR